MTEKPKAGDSDTPTRPVRLFRNGTNQAVRIPREFELPGTEATIRKIGNALVLEPVAPKPAFGTVGALLAALDEIALLGPAEHDFPDVDQGLLPVEDVKL